MPPSTSTIPTTFTSYGPNFFFFTIIFCIHLLSHGSITVAGEGTNTVYMGAIMDANSRIGKEAKTAMNIYVQNFNKDPNYNYKLELLIRDSGRDPLRAASAADELINKHQVKAIIGLEIWQEVALVAQVKNQDQVPIISFAKAAVPASLTSKQWPFLVRMSSNESLQMRCVAAIVGGFQWRKVIVIYEEDTYGINSGVITLLSDALQDVGSEIEYRLAFPPISSISDPKSSILETLLKLKSKQSRVFILVQSSLSFATHLFTEANKIGLVGKESVWITTDTITNALDSFNSSTISSMKGLLGIKTYISETSTSITDFKLEFRKAFLKDYPEEHNIDPGIFALRPYDAISTVTRAMESLTNNGKSKVLLESILSSNFSGLSGEIWFQDGELSNSLVLQIVNVVENGYRELDLWTPESGFYIKEGEGESGGCDGGEAAKMLNSQVEWPGGLQRLPRGWVMPTDAKTLKIGVPNRSSGPFEKIMKVEENKNPNLPPLVTGFCIEVFEEAVKILSKEYPVSYDYVPFNETYEELINQVHDKKLDAAVGDMTILTNRFKKVEFTQPYVESSLAMVVPLRKQSQKEWMFMNPFTRAMWLVTGAISIYTMLVIWFLEHRNNPNFRGPWKVQLSNALWFTSSTLFFVHREKLHSNYTRAVMVIWLFVVLVLTYSYTASLTSILTVQPLVPTAANIESLKKNNSTVGCDGDLFIKNYLVNVLGFKEENIKNISGPNNYLEEFEHGNIAAAFMEIPYQKLLFSKFCKRYTTINSTYRFGGFGFAFPQGSPLTKDISKAILTLSEKGKITELNKKWFYPDQECSNSETEIFNESLSLNSFWGLFVLTGGTSTFVLLLYIIHLLRRYPHHQETDQDQKTPSFRQVDADVDGSSSGWEYISMHNTPRHPEASPATEIEMPERSNV